MEKMKLNSKKIIVWLCVNYGIFVFAFFSLGLFGEKYRMVLWINFFLDVAICIISLILNKESGNIGFHYLAVKVTA